MRGFTKYIMIFSLIIFIIGLLLCILGGIMGGKMHWSFESGESETISKDFEEVDNINIKLNYGSFNIKNGEKFKIEGLVSKNANFKTEINDGTLEISNTRKFWNLFSAFDKNPEQKLTLYIPNNFDLKNCNIDIGACELNIEELKTENLKVSVGAGNCLISKLDCNECTFNIGAGDLDVVAKINKTIKIDCGVGDAKVVLIGLKKDFDYSVDNGVGSIDIAGLRYDGLGTGGKLDNHSDKKIIIDCGVGSVNVDFKEE